MTVTALSRANPELLAIIMGSTMAEGVAFTNNTFGKGPIGFFRPDGSLASKLSEDEFWMKIDNQVKIIEQELEETEQAIEEEDAHESRDGISDILVTALGLPHLASFPICTNQFELVTTNYEESVFTRLASQIEAVAKTFEAIEKAVEIRDSYELMTNAQLMVDQAVGLSEILGNDVVADMQEVLASNLSKVCPDANDAEATVAYYQNDLDVKTYSSACPTFEGLIIKVVSTQPGKDGKEYPAGKFLKSLGNFKKPVFN